MARALREALEADESVVLLGTGYGGLSTKARASFSAALEGFSGRVLATPVSELAVAGAGIGASLAGLRPLVCLGTASFIFEAWPQVVNEAPNIRYMSGGQSSAPVTFYVLGGIRGRMPSHPGPSAAQHSARPQAMLAGVPGLQVMAPAAPRDVYGMLRWVLLKSTDPTVFVNHTALFDEEEDVPDGVDDLPPGRARVRREGGDVTLIGHSVATLRCLEAARLLEAQHGLSVEVVDLRSLSPLDEGAILRSVEKTGHAVVVDECHRSFGVSAEIAALLAERGFHALQGPVKRVTVPDVPVPYSPVLEQEITVTAERVVQAALECRWPGARSFPAGA